MERFVIIVKGWKPLTIIAKHSILDVAADVDPPLLSSSSLTICYVEQSPADDIILEQFLSLNSCHLMRQFGLVNGDC